MPSTSLTRVKTRCDKIVKRLEVLAGKLQPRIANNTVGQLPDQEQAYTLTAAFLVKQATEMMTNLGQVQPLGPAVKGSGLAFSMPAERAAEAKARGLSERALLIMAEEVFLVILPRVEELCDAAEKLAE